MKFSDQFLRGQMPWLAPFGSQVLHNLPPVPAAMHAFLSANHDDITDFRKVVVPYVDYTLALPILTPPVDCSCNAVSQFLELIETWL